MEKNFHSEVEVLVEVSEHRRRTVQHSKQKNCF